MKLVAVYIVLMIPIMLLAHISAIYPMRMESSGGVVQAGYGSTYRAFLAPPGLEVSKRRVRRSNGLYILQQDYTVSPQNGSTIYDDTPASIRLNITWENTSGILNVYIRYSYNNVSWTGWIETNNSGGSYYIDIEENEWKQHIGEKIYWEVNKTYEENATTNSTRIGVFIVYLGDDDPEPPQIYMVNICEGIEGDGVAEADEELYVEFRVNDTSGIGQIIVEYEATDGSGNLSWSIVGQNNYEYIIKTELFGPVAGGTLNITITVWDGDDDGWAGDSLSKTEQKRFQIPKEDVELIMDPPVVSVNYSDQQVLTIDVRRDDGGIDLGGLEIILEIYSEGICIYNETTNTSTSGLVEFIIDPMEMGLDPGQYDLNVTFEGDPHFSRSLNKTWLHVNIETRLNITMNTDIRYGENVLIEAKLWQLDENNTPLENRRIDFYCNVSGSLLLIGSNYTDENGIATLRWIVNVSHGTYMFMAKYDGAPHYYESSSSVIVTVSKSNVYISCDKLYWLVYSDGGTIKANITDEFGNSVDGANISLYLVVEEGYRYLGSNVSRKGIIMFVFTKIEGGIPPPDDILPGNYTCVFRFDGDSRYNPSENNQSIVCIQKEILVSSQISLNTSYVEWGDGVLITITAVDDDGENITMGDVEIMLFTNGTLIYNTTTTFVDGKAEFSVRAAFGIYLNITVDMEIYTYAYDTSELVEKHAWFFVIPERILIETANSTWKTKYGVESAITLNLHDNDGKIPMDGELILNITTMGYSWIISIPYIDGVCNITYPFSYDLLPGTYSIHIVNISWSQYVLSEEYVITLYIEKLRTYSLLKEVNLTYGDTGRILVWIFDERGEPVQGILVLAKIGNDTQEGIIIQGVTNESGYVLLVADIDMRPGNYTLFLSWGGTETHLGGNDGYRILIAKERLIIHIDVGGQLVVWGEAQIYVNITDDEGNPAYPLWINIYAGDILLYNGTYDAPMSIRWTPQESGDIKIEVDVLENEYYESAHGEKIVHVKEGERNPAGRYYVLIPAITFLVMLVLILAIRRIHRKV